MYVYTKRDGSSAAVYLVLTYKYFYNDTFTVLPAKSDRDVMFYLKSNQGLRIDRSLVY